MLFDQRPVSHPLDGLKGSKGQNSTFLEHSHVAYHIKENKECSNMEANILPTNPTIPPTLGMGSQGQNSLFQNMIMLHINLKRITNAATW